MREALRKLGVITALFALLLPGLSALGESLSAADLPPCCNTIYCPLHHRQMNDVQRDKSNCDGMGALRTEGLLDAGLRHRAESRR